MGKDVDLNREELKNKSFPEESIGKSPFTEEKTLQAHYRHYREVIRELTMMSDALMRNVLKEPACTEYMLQVILEKEIKITDVVIQEDHKNLRGRSAILDCVAKDEDGRRYNLEVQQERSGAAPRRARYHSGILDANTLNHGEDYDQLPETFIIFITREDVMKAGLPVYHIERKIEETKEAFGDQAHILYVNASIQDDTRLGRLMHDLQCREADQMYSKILAEQVRKLKETPEGVEEMCEIMDRIYQEGRLEGREEGRIEGFQAGRQESRREVARELRSEGFPADRIAKILKTNVKTIEQWLAGEKLITR